MNRFQCSECGKVEFSYDDIEYVPCPDDCGGEMICVPFEYGGAPDLTEWSEDLAW